MNLQDAQTAVAMKLPPGTSFCITQKAWFHAAPAYPDDRGATYNVRIWDGSKHHDGKTLDGAVQTMLAAYQSESPTLAANLAAEMESLAQPEAGQ